jgi:CHAT domain-containing protein/tetratricopeptide (TPR) repeat protein
MRILIIIGLAIAAASPAVAATSISPALQARLTTSAAAMADPDSIEPSRQVDLARAHLALCVEAWGPASMETARCEIELGRALVTEMVFPQAETVLRAAIGHLAALPGAKQARWTARAQSLLGETLDRRSRYKDAEVELAAALASQTDPADRALTLRRQVGVLTNQGRYLEAETTLVAARAATAQATGLSQFDQAMLLIEAGNLGNARDRLEQSEADLNAALAILAKAHGPTDSRLGLALEPLGLVISIRRGKAASEPVYERALAIEQTRSRVNNLRLGSALGDLGNVYSATGRIALALDVRRQSLALAESDGPAPSQELAIRLYNLAQILSDLQRYDEAIPLLVRSRAAAITVYGKDHPNVAYSMNELAEAYAKTGRLDLAIPIMTEVVRVREAAWGAEHFTTIYARHYLGSHLLGANRPAEARPVLELALAASERRFGVEALDTTRIRVTLAQSLTRLKQTELAMVQVRAALLALRRPALGNLAALGARPVPASGTKDAYGASLNRLLFVMFELSDQRPDIAADTFLVLQALDTEQRGSSGSWRAAARLSAKDPELRELAGAQQAGMARLGAAQRQQATAARTGDRTQAMTLAATIQTERADLDKLAATVQQRFPAFAQLAGGVDVPLTRMNEGQKALLGKDEVLVALHQIDEAILAMVVSWHGSFMVKLGNASSKTVSAAVASLRASTDIAKAASASDLPLFDVAVAHDLYNRVLAPLEPHLKGARTVFIASDGALARLPLGLLVTRPSDDPDPFTRYRRSHWLADRYALVTLPTVNALAAWRNVARPSRADRPLLAFADPVLPGRTQVASLAGFTLLRGAAQGETLAVRTSAAICAMAPLPDSRREAEQLAVAMKANIDAVLLGPRASESEVRRRAVGGDLARYRTVLFATHGLLAGTNSEDEAALVLTPPASCKATDDTDDGLLTASEISLLSFDADLVILSGCNTAGGGDSVTGTPLSGLVQAFQYAGARRLLVSHWSVDSAATADLMTALFTHRSHATATSLQAAMRDLRQKPGHLPYHSHPAFWAPFVLVGDSR